MKNRLTKRAIENARAAMLENGKRRLILWDDIVPMFGALLSQKGASLFVRYVSASRVERHMTIGTLNEVTVDVARKRAAEVRVAVRAGADPVQALRDQRKEAEGRLTLESAVETWLAQHQKQWAKTTAYTYRQTLARNVLPKLGHHELATITRAQWAKVLTDVASRKPALARLLRHILGSLVTWAVDRELMPASTLPSAKRVTPKTGVREQVITDGEIRTIWAAADALEDRQRAFARFIMLTAMRREATARTRHEWIDGQTINYPGAVMKGGEAHRVALSEWAWQQIGPVLEPYLFTGTDKPLGNASTVLRELRKHSGITDWRFHDFRRSFRSWAARTGISRDAAETVLSHRIHRDEVDKAYQRHRFEHESEHAFHAWQMHIQRLVEGGSAGDNVVTLWASAEPN